MAAVGEARKLDAGGASVVEERLDRRPNRSAGVEDVVDEHARPPLERKVELRRADERLRVLRRLAAAHLDIVPVEGDVHRSELELLAREVGDQPAEPVCERNAARVNTDEGDLVELRIPLDDLVCDSRECPLDRVAVEENLLPRDSRPDQGTSSVESLRPASYIGLLSGLSGPS